LKGLGRVRFSGTNVSDLSPLAQLPELTAVELDNTPVTDLSPLAEIAVTSPTFPTDGLSFNNCPIADPVVRSLADEDNPERTLNTIAHLRRQKQLPRLDADKRPPSVPDLPAQGPGPHFVVGEQGVVTFAPPDDIDQQGNNLAQLRTLHPSLRELTRSLAEVLGRGNVPHADLRERVQDYLTLVDQDLQTVPFGRLYVEGVRLQNAATAANSKIAERELPSFDASVQELLHSTLALHGTFILATAEGMALLASEERYQRRPQEEQEFRAAALALRRSCETAPSY
jgi:hypothetical protein